MSSIFNLSKILNNQIPDLVQKVRQRTFLSEAINLVERYDKNIILRKNQLYSSLLEADSVKEENNKFADFFKDFKKIIDDNILKAQAFATQFGTTIETFADANKDLYDISKPEMSGINTNYKGVQYDFLLDDSVPNIDPYKAFKEEFAMLGKLLQDLSPIATDDQKAGIIATVCNNLAKKLDDNWIGKCTEKIAQCDDCNKEEFARVMYNKFVQNTCTDITLDIGAIKQAKLAIMNYTQYIQTINKSTNDLCEGLSKIADEIGSLFFRNQDHRFEVSSDDEDVEDKTYHFSDYSFNQLNKFIMAKVSQINELYNLYLVAISIKMDCIYKYLQQCKNMIEVANGTATNTNDNCDSYGNGEESDSNSDDDLDSDDIEDTDDNVEDDTSDEKEDEPEIIENDDKSEEVDPNSEPVSEEDPTEDEAPIKDKDAQEVDDSESEFETEAYLFEASMMNLNRMINAFYEQSRIFDMINEDSLSGTASNTADVGKASIKEKIVRLFNKFKDTFTKNYSERIRLIIDNSDRIKKATIPEGWTIQRMDVSKLLSFKLAPFNPADKFEDEDQYIQSKYGRYIAAASGDATSIKERILANGVLSKKEEQYTDADRKEGFDWITKDYKVATTIMQQFSDAYNKALEVNFGIKESVVLNNEAVTAMYFNEDSFGEANDGPDKTNNQETAAATSKQQQSIFINANSKILVALMNVFNMKTKKELRFLEKLANAKTNKTEGGEETNAK